MIQHFKLPTSMHKLTDMCKNLVLLMNQNKRHIGHGNSSILEPFLQKSNESRYMSNVQVIGDEDQKQTNQKNNMQTVHNHRSGCYNRLSEANKFHANSNKTIHI